MWGFFLWILYFPRRLPPSNEKSWIMCHKWQHPIVVFEHRIIKIKFPRTRVVFIFDQNYTCGWKSSHFLIKYQLFIANRGVKTFESECVSNFWRNIKMFCVAMQGHKYSRHASKKLRALININSFSEIDRTFFPSLT